MRTLLFALVLMGWSATTIDAQSNPKKDIVDTAVAAGSFKTLATALEAADLVGALKGKGPFTVFAPTDAAFAKLPKKTLAELLEPKNRKKLTQILTYHVVPGRIATRNVLDLRSANTLNGQQLRFDTRDGIRIGSSRVIRGDIGAKNGIIHVIDEVLLPSFDDIPATATKAKAFQTLLAAVKAAKLVATLSGDGPFTVFAPTDEAFAKLPDGTIASLLKPENRDRLVEILTYHVVPGRVYASDALKAGTAKTVQGKAVKAAFDEGSIRINDANVVSSDIDASNGVIHVIDSVLMPPAPPRQGRLILGFHYDHPSHSFREQYGLSRDEGILIKSTSRGQGAEAAGLRKNDVIVRIDGMPATIENLRKAKERRGEGGKVDLVVVRSLPVEVSLEKH